MISIWGFLYFSILCILLSRKIIYGKPGAGKRQGLPYLTERESKNQSVEPIIIIWHIYRCTAGIRCTTGHNHILPAQFHDFHLGLNVLYSTPPQPDFPCFPCFFPFSRFYRAFIYSGRLCSSRLNGSLPEKLQFAGHAQTGHEIAHLAAGLALLRIRHAVTAVLVLQMNAKELVDAAAANIAPVLLLNESVHRQEQRLLSVTCSCLPRPPLPRPAPYCSPRYRTLKPQFLRNKLTPRESSNSCVFFWMAETLIPWPSPVSTR